MTLTETFGLVGLNALCRECCLSCQLLIWIKLVMEFRSCLQAFPAISGSRPTALTLGPLPIPIPRRLSASVSCTDDGRLSGDLFRWKESLAR
jgi:hypothetical protein